MDNLKKPEFIGFIDQIKLEKKFGDKNENIEFNELFDLGLQN